MPTRESILRVRKVRHGLMLAGLATLGGCLGLGGGLGSVSIAAAEDSAGFASNPTLSQLFKADAAGRTSNKETLLFGEEGATGTSTPQLVTFLADDPILEKDPALAKDAPAKAGDQEAAPDKEPKELPATDLNVMPEGDRLGGASIFGGDAERSPTVRSGRFELPTLMVATTQTSEIGNGRTPEGFRGDDAQLLAALPESGMQRGVDWDWTVRSWAAPNTYSHPRYFEDRMLERHGHERFPCLQPLASGARFFATIPMLPYLAAVQSPCDCEYTLGYYRTGSCAPALKQRPPYERKAVIVGAASVASRVLVLP